MSHFKKIQASIFASTILLVFTGIVSPNYATASNSGDCPFGQKYIEGDYNSDTEEFDYSCEPSEWEYELSNDGFSKRMTLSMDEDLYGLPGGTTIYDLTMIARCENKKLEVFFSSSYILYENQNRTYSKKFQYKLDNGKINSGTIDEATSDKAFFISSPKTLLTNMLKAKSKLNIKFATSKGSGVSQFPVADFAKYRSKFASAGCKI